MTINTLFSNILRKLFSDSVYPPSGEDIDYIYYDAVESMNSIARSNHPNEFIGMLNGEQIETDSGTYNVITGLSMIPGSFSDSTSATLQSYNVPNSREYVGIVHSHPNGVLQPSVTDKNTFSGGRIHIITGYPYNKQSWKAFNRRGEEVPLEIVHKSEL
jgi:proteasome lid subunit RPN8/RPN11